ncbi:uncharacterized protein LOC105832716 [Monomorium pharaonis]|uniref:uncharacterized protein LOC105832716 n=1 Tax=Monomorium pharaonis TaxID=307658 RepID=UPI00063F7E67|nr:uncharacterized protein LOC105832716 [Monomorium pharaonis]
MRVPSLAGSRYFVTFVDDKTRYCKVVFIAQKSKIFEKSKAYKAKVKKQTGLTIKTLRSDNDREYLSNKFRNFFEKEKIVHQLTTEYTPEQNGVAERFNRTLVKTNVEWELYPTRLRSKRSQQRITSSRLGKWHMYSIKVNKFTQMSARYKKTDVISDGENSIDDFYSVDSVKEEQPSDSDILGFVPAPTFIRDGHPRRPKKVLRRVTIKTSKEQPNNVKLNTAISKDELDKVIASNTEKNPKTKNSLVLKKSVLLQ